MKNEKYINPFSQISDHYAQKLDEATIAKNVSQLENLINEIEDQINNEDLASQARLYYSLGTVYSDFAKKNGLAFEESVKKQLYYYRKSISIIEDDEYSKKEHSPYINSFKTILYTNYANALGSCGRIIEAISQYKKVLLIRPSFGMALGNLGRSYID